VGSIPETGIELASRLRHLAEDLGQGRTGRIVGSRGWIPHLSAGVRSGRKALSYIGLAQGSTPPPIPKPDEPEPNRGYDGSLMDDRESDHGYGDA